MGNRRSEKTDPKNPKFTIAEATGMIMKVELSFLGKLK